MIHTLHKQGHSIRAISRITGIDRRTISKRLKENEIKPYKKRTYPSKLDAFKDYIDLYRRKCPASLEIPAQLASSS